MMKRTHCAIGAFLAVLHTSGCLPAKAGGDASKPPEAAPPVQAASVDPDLCGAAKLQHLIGKTQAEASKEKLPAKVRHICFDCQVTMDFREDRLNIQYDAQGKITQVRCG